LEEYFPDSVRYAKEIEFMQLEQGNLLVTEYATRFKHLARFYTHTMTEAWRCRKFEFGLKKELKEVVIPMSIRDFPTLVEKEKVVESLKNSSRLAKTQVGGRPSKSMPKYEDRKKPYFRPQSYSSGRPNSQSPPSFKCFRCGGPHVVRFFLHSVSNVTCDRCHKYGHATKDCCVQLGAPNSGGVQKYNKIVIKNPKLLAEFLLLVELKLHSLIALLKVFVLSLEHSYLYCLILGQPILLYLLIVLRSLSCQSEN